MLQTLNILENFDLKVWVIILPLHTYALPGDESCLLTAIFIMAILFPAGRTDQWIAIKRYAKQRAL